MKLGGSDGEGKSDLIKRGEPQDRIMKALSLEDRQEDMMVVKNEGLELLTLLVLEKPWEKVLTRKEQGLSRRLCLGLQTRLPLYSRRRCLIYTSSTPFLSPAPIRPVGRVFYTLKQRS